MTTMEISRLCSNFDFDRLRQPVYSTGNAMRLHFLTDFDVTSRGFLAVVSAEPGLHLVDKTPIN